MSWSGEFIKGWSFTTCKGGSDSGRDEGRGSVQHMDLYQGGYGYGRDVVGGRCLRGSVSTGIHRAPVSGSRAGWYSTC